jgi:hypothetical protein
VLQIFNLLQQPTISEGNRCARDITMRLQG